MKKGGQRARRAVRRAAFHAARLASATTPRQACEAAFDQVRAQVADLRPDRRDEGWKTVTRHLDQAGKEIAHINTHS